MSVIVGKLLHSAMTEKTNSISTHSPPSSVRSSDKLTTGANKGPILDEKTKFRYGGEEDLPPPPTLTPDVILASRMVIYRF